MRLNWMERVRISIRKIPFATVCFFALKVREEERDFGLNYDIRHRSTTKFEIVCSVMSASLVDKYWLVSRLFWDFWDILTMSWLLKLWGISLSSDYFQYWNSLRNIEISDVFAGVFQTIQISINKQLLVTVPKIPFQLIKMKTRKIWRKQL